MKVTINNTDIDLRYTFRGLMIYENITKNNGFTPTGITDVIFFLYSMIQGSAPRGVSIKFEDFEDWLDATPNVLPKFYEWLAEVNEANAQLGGEDEDVADDGKN